MALKLYFDLMSQPSRALYLFLNAAKIPFEPKPIKLDRGMYLLDKYEQMLQKSDIDNV